MLMLFRKARFGKKGYTLTELIVVVAILGILAAVATPMIASQVGKANQAADAANAKAIENSIKLAVAQGDSTITNSDGTVKTLTTALVTPIVKASLGSVPTPKTLSGFFEVATDGSVVKAKANDAGGGQTADNNFAIVGP